MVKGSVVRQKNTIDVQQVNYRQLAALNVSMIKLFDSDPVKFFEQFKLGRTKRDTKTTSLAIGDLVDFYLLDCKGNEEEFDERFDEKFALFEGNKGTGQVFVLADSLFEIAQRSLDDGAITRSFDSMFTEAFNKVQTVDKKYNKKTEDYALKDFNENGCTYYQTLMDNIGKTVIDVSLLDKAKKVAKALMDDPFTADVFQDNDDIEFFPKLPIEWSYKTKSGKLISCKSEIDMLKIDHAKKIIYPMDLKTTYDNEMFEVNYLKNGYYLQAAFYWLAVEFWSRENDMTDYTVKPMEFVVGDTSANNRRPIRYSTNHADLLAGLKGFSYKGTEYRGVHELVEEISWCEDNNMWNVSKRVFDANGKLKLNLKYD